jgi:hypothetical protein
MNHNIIILLSGWSEFRVWAPVHPQQRPPSCADARKGGGSFARKRHVVGSVVAGEVWYLSPSTKAQSSLPGTVPVAAYPGLLLATYAAQAMRPRGRGGEESDAVDHRNS